MRKTKTDDIKVRWLVATKVPKEKALWMKLRGYSQTEIFGFPKKQNAKDFVSDVTAFGVECLISKA
jgi:hypothetical protein